MTGPRKYPKGKTNRILLFCDLRNSTEILQDFESGRFGPGNPEPGGYEEFILDVHATTFRELYLGHEQTYSEIYGDGLLAVFPEDNTKFLLENIYHLTQRMHAYNARKEGDVSKPPIDIGFGVTVATASFVYFDLDQRDHAVGVGVHEAARIQSLSRHFRARVLISRPFFDYARPFVDADPRFSFRFIDFLHLKGLRKPTELHELVIDTDPRFQLKIHSDEGYREAYRLYRSGRLDEARTAFLALTEETGLEIGTAMAERCEFLLRHPEREWDGIWKD